MNGKSAKHLQHAVDLLAFGKYLNEQRFGAGSNDGDAVDQNKIKVAKAFIKWIKDGKATSDSIQKDFITFLQLDQKVVIDVNDFTRFLQLSQSIDIDDEPKTVEVAKLGIRQSHGLFVHDEDAVFRDLHISKDLNENVQKMSKVLLIIDGKSAGYRVTDRNQRKDKWLLIEYDNKMDLVGAMSRTDHPERFKNFYPKEIEDRGLGYSRTLKMFEWRKKDRPKGKELTKEVEMNLRQFLR